MINFTKDNLEVINREISTQENTNSGFLALKNKRGDGMAILKNIPFAEGTIDIELKGENTPGRSFVGVAFNIQNDSTYEAVYFRPFNFQSDKKIRREHSIQYISHPEYAWKYLRTNFEGKYEAEYPRRPAPNDWFGVKIKIDDDRVYVYDKESGTELLTVERIEKQKSNKIGLWTGNNSKGEFRNLRILE